MKSLWLFLVATSCALGQAPVNQQNSSSSVAGTWVAEHRSMGGIGSLWVFHPDGTLSMSAGAMVDMPYKLEGVTLTLPPGTTGPDAKPQVSKVSFPGDQMCMTVEDAKGPLCFTRIGSPHPGAAAIVGKWKPIPHQQFPANGPGTLQDEKQKEMARKAFQGATWIFTPDGTLKLRIPFRTDQGSWDKATRSFSLSYAGAQISGKFRLEAGKLVLTQPDGKSEDTYVRDED